MMMMKTIGNKVDFKLNYFGVLSISLRRAAFLYLMNIQVPLKHEFAVSEKKERMRVLSSHGPDGRFL